MNASLFYRITAGLLLIFAILHTIGFSQTDPSVMAVVTPMQTLHFDAMGSSRTYWDFFLAAGYTVGALYLLLAIVLWQLGGLGADSLSKLRFASWALALCFAGITYLSWRYLFIAPLALSGLITLSLTLAALLASKR
jgi:hypothetical protein